MDQILTVRSALPVTANRPSLSTACDQIEAVCMPGIDGEHRALVQVRPGVRTLILRDSRHEKQSGQ